MFKRRLTIEDFLLMAVNIIPLIGVWFYNWDARQVFLVYCMETVIIGLTNVIKMACVTIFVRSTDVWENNGGSSMQSGWFFIFFFIIHYGFFVFIQTQLFFGVSGLLPDGSLLMKYSKIPVLLGRDGKLLLLIFIAYYSMQVVFGFFASGDYKNVSLGRLMFEPYMRIFVQQIVVILGSMFLSFGAGKIFILVFVAAKIFFELYLNFGRVLEIIDKRSKLKKKQAEQED
ncbi:MAG: DUF6498-containing protein [Ferruginibacter sp.]